MARAGGWAPGWPLSSARPLPGGGGRSVSALRWVWLLHPCRPPLSAISGLVCRVGALLKFRPTWIPALLLPLKPVFPCENCSLSKPELHREVAICVGWSCSQIAAPRLLCHLHAGQVGVSEGYPEENQSFRGVSHFGLCYRVRSRSHMNTEAEVCACLCIDMHSSGQYKGRVWVASDSRDHWHSRLGMLCSTMSNWPCRSPKPLELVLLAKNKAFALCFEGFKKHICSGTSVRLESWIQRIVIF